MKTVWCAGQRGGDGESLCVPRDKSANLVVCNLSPRSQSKMRGDCLFYEEKIETTEEEKRAKTVRRFVRFSKFCHVFPEIKLQIIVL